MTLRGSFSPAYESIGSSDSDIKVETFDGKIDWVKAKAVK